jgi:streptogramin lyase
MKTTVRLGVLLGCGLGCGSSAPAAPSQCARSYDAVVATSDYSSSGVGALSLDGGVTMGFGVDLGQDPALSESRGRVFFVARYEDQIFELDRACGAPVARFSVHGLARRGAANPQDVAVAPDGTLWVPLFNEPAIALVGDGSTLERIDLSALDPDGNPQASAVSMIDVGGASKAFVVLELLDADLKSRRKSKIARFDARTHELEETRELLARNPFGRVHESGGALWLAAPGNFDALAEPDAGIERFDPATGESKMIVTEADLGGSAVEVAVRGACGVAIVADATSKNATSLVTFDAEKGVVLAPASRALLRTEDFDLRSLAWLGDRLLVGDRRRAGAGYPIHVFDRTGACDLHEAPSVFVSQKPVGLIANR